MSAYRFLYDSVFEALESCSVINTVEDYNEQYLEPEQYNLVKYPAAYIETGVVNWNKDTTEFTITELEPQTGTAEINIHVVFNTLNGLNKVQKDRFFSICDFVVGTLQRLQGGNTEIGTFTTLMRTREEYITPNKQLRVAIITFSTQLKDQFINHSDEYVEETVELVLTKEIEID